MSISRSDIFTFKYFEYGEIFHGSYRGMRYQLGREPLETVWFMPKEKKEEGTIKACIWPEPLSFECTEEEKKKYKEFEFSEAGVNQAVDWFNQVWEEEYERSK